MNLEYIMYFMSMVFCTLFVSIDIKIFIYEFISYFYTSLTNIGQEMFENIFFPIRQYSFEISNQEESNSVSF